MMSDVKSTISVKKNSGKLVNLPAEKLPKKTRKMVKTKHNNDILGLGLAFVIASITYSTYIVWAGTSGVGPKIMLTPQILFAGFVIYKVFSKALK